MSARIREQWLLSLADPMGPRQLLPDGRLCAAEPEPLWTEADRHGVLPALAANLQVVIREQGAERVLAGGPGGQERLEDALSAARARILARTGLSLMLRRQLRTIMPALAERGLPAVVLKGPDFCDRLYPEPVLRPFTDIDLLAPPEAVPQVEAALAALGYRAEPAPDRKHAEGYGERSWRLPDGAGGGVPAMAAGTVEVHWNLVNSPPMQKRVSVEFADLQLEGAGGAMRPTASALLAVAAVHGATGHRFDRLQVLCDVCQAARCAAGALDEGWLAEFGRRTGSAEVMATALWLAGEALGEPRCAELRERLFGRLPGPTVRLLLGPRVVLRSRRPLARLRRQLYRELLKRR
jgi:hypothetical protein